MRRFIGHLCNILFILCGAYVGVWLMLILSVKTIYDMIDCGSIDVMVFVISGIKIIFSLSTGGAISFIGFFIDATLNPDKY